MFYTFELLCKLQGGIFFHVYKAGTIGIKSIKDEDLEKISVCELGQKICVKIATTSMRAQDRLSLRLSAILVNGLIRIYEFQVAILLEQCGDSKGLVYGNLEEIVPIITSSAEQSSALITPELVVVKKRKPRMSRKKIISDIEEFRSPLATRSEKKDIDVDDVSIPILTAIFPQRDVMEIQMSRHIEQDSDTLRHIIYESDDSTPTLVQRNIIVEADVHVPPPRYATEDETIAQAKSIPDITKLPGFDVTEPVTMQTIIHAEQDQIAMPPPSIPGSSVRTPKPIEPESIHAILQNLPRKINRNIQEESLLLRPTRYIIDVFNAICEERDMSYTMMEDIEGDFVDDGLRDEEFDIIQEHQSIEKIKTPQVSSHSLSRLEISKSHRDSIVPEEEISGVPMEGIELQPITEEVEDHDFHKLSTRAQELVKKLRNLAPALKIVIEDLCRKPLQKKEIVTTFHALLEIQANTNIIDLVTKSDEDLYIDHILINCLNNML